MTELQRAALAFAQYAHDVGEDCLEFEQLVMALAAEGLNIDTLEIPNVG